MAKAKDVKKGTVVALEGGYWVVEDYHSQHTGRRRPVLHIKMRNLKTGHVIDRSFDEADHLDEPEMDAIRLNVNAVAVAAGLEGNDLHGRIVLESRSSLEGRSVRGGGTMGGRTLPGRAS